MKLGNQHQKIFFGPVQGENSQKNKSNVIDDYDNCMDDEFLSDEKQKQQFYDQEHMMTEQDFDGHQHEEEEDPYHDHHEQDSDYRDEVRDSNDEDEDNENEQNSQEGNVPVSSQSVSPDKDRYTSNLQQQKPIMRQLLQSEQEEMARASSIIEGKNRISANTNNTNVMSNTYNNIPFNQDNMVVEKNDRFMVFKAVSSMQTVLNSGIGIYSAAEKQQRFQNQYKLIRHDPLEEIDSDEEGKAESGFLNQRDSEFNMQDYSSHILDESQFEEHNCVSQNDIKSLKNQLVNQSLTGGQKPPIVKRMQTANDNTCSSTLPHNNNNLKSLNSFNYQQDSSNNNNKGNEGLLYKKGFTSNSRSSSNNSGGFTKLQKLEKKNLNEEQTNVNQLTDSNQRQLEIVSKKASQQNNVLPVDEPFESSHDIIEPIRLNERRQSDSIVIRQSLIQQQNSMFNQQIPQQNVTSTHFTNVNTGANDSNKSNDPEHELLKQELMKLKKTLNKLKKDPAPGDVSQIKKVSQAQSKGRPQVIAKKNQQQLSQMRSNPQTLKKEELKSQVKSKKNLKIGIGENQHTYNNLLSQNFSDSDDDYNGQSKLIRHNKGAFSQQQSTKNRDAKGKPNIFKEQQMSKLGQAKRDKSQNKKSQRQSPIRNTVKQTEKNHQRKQSKFKPNNESEDKNLSDGYESRSNHKSFRTHSKYRAKNQNIKHKHHHNPLKQPNRHKHRHESEDEEEYNEYDQESNGSSYCNCSACKGGDYSYDKDETFNKNFSMDSEYQNDSSYYDSRDNKTYSNEEDEDDSQKYSDSSNSSSGHKRRRHHQKQKSKHKSGGQGKKDRKLKININMNGQHLSRQQRQEMHTSQEEQILRQRQIIQQQQYLMAMAQQYPQQQLMFQQQLQQLALQQQMLMQQPNLLPQQNQFLNMQPSTNNLGINLDMINYQQPLGQNLNNISAIGGQNSNTPIVNQKPRETAATDYIQRGLQKNYSGTNLTLMSQQPGGIGATSHRNLNNELRDLSPQRSFLIGNQMSQNQPYQASLLSPRELSTSNRPQDDQQTMPTSSQSSYLNQLKNRFRTGTTNQVEDYSSQIGSRNQTNVIGQNNSSPSPHGAYGREQVNVQQRDQILSYRGQENQNRFEEARRFISDYPQVSHDNSKHARTNSLMDYQRLNDYEQPKNEYGFQKYESKVTGDFGKLRSENATPIQTRKDPVFLKANDASGSHSDSGDSMDEGVKASNAHETVMKSPKANTKEFQIKLIRNEVKAVNRNSIKADFTLAKPKPNQSKVQQSSPNLNKQASNKSESKAIKDQDKKGPQALIIGFEDENQLKDPFKNKPQLKSREEVIKGANKDLIQRSKSSKGVEKTPIGGGPKKLSLQQKRQLEKQEKSQDQQLRSPINMDAPTSKKNNLINEQLQKNESPLKRVVLDLKKDPKAQLKQQQAKPQGNAPKKAELIIINADDEDEQEILDPSHNQNVLIEICDKKKPQTKKQQEVSLAEMFKAKQKQGEINVTKVKPQSQQAQDQDQELQQQVEGSKKEKTKEELAELRKKMMKSNVKRKGDNFSQQNIAENHESGASNNEMKGGKKQAPPKDDLMSRLAMGQKVPVDKKEMKKLTNKNYQNLPEIKKKKEEEAKRELERARKQAALEYNKQLNEKRRAILKKKKSMGGDE